MRSGKRKAPQSKNDREAEYGLFITNTSTNTPNCQAGCSPVGPEQITPSSIGPEQLDPVKFPVQYSGGSFSGGNTTLKTFTPKSNGVIFVTAHARRNSATAADINLTLGGSGMTDIRTNAGTGYGTADAHATTSLVAEVTKDTPVSLTMNASGGSVVNTGWTMLVVPGSAELV